MPSLFEVHYPPVLGPPPAVAPIVVTPPNFVPGQGTGTGGANNPYASDNYATVSCGKQDRTFRLVYATGNNTVATDSCDYAYPVTGMLIVKMGETQAIMQKEGRIAQISGLTPGQRYFLYENGQIIAPPFAVGEVHYVQQVGYGLDDGTFYLQPTGIVYERDVSQGGDGGAEPEQAYANPGPPSMQQVYPPENIYIDSNTGNWYEQPGTANAPSQFYVGYGAPVAGATYQPVAVYLDKTQGGYYTMSSTPNVFAPITSGEGAPTNGAVSQYRTVYFNNDTGDAYYQ